MYAEDIWLDYCKFYYIDIILILLNFVGYPSQKTQIEVTLLISENILQNQKDIFWILYIHLEYLNRITLKNAWFITAGQGISETPGSYLSLKVTNNGQSCDFFQAEMKPPKNSITDEK